MFPLEFDHNVLDNLPIITEHDSKRVIGILKTIVFRRVLPYYKKHRGTDAILAAQIQENLEIVRLEDDDNCVRSLSIAVRKNGSFKILVHERIFDYLAFLIPGNIDHGLMEGGPEEKKMLALSEFMLRHEIEHILYPNRSLRELITSDALFAEEKRISDPTYYHALRRSLCDELNGLRGETYLRLFDRSEGKLNDENQVSELVSRYVYVLRDYPENLLDDIFPFADEELNLKLLGACFRRTGETNHSLFIRTVYLQKLLHLFLLLMNGDPVRAEKIFEKFKNRWGFFHLLRELDIPENSVEDKSPKEMFEIFKDRLKLMKGKATVTTPPTVSMPKPQPEPVAPKSMKERIEEARENRHIPKAAFEIIDKNKLNAVGQSGSKYSELIDTLLAIPWGKIKKIEVSPHEFETGLNKSHHGLVKPKEMTADIFSNLIWRYQDFDESEISGWRGTGSSFLLVGPPGVGKTSLAISIAKNLGIPYHKISLGGMRDEADLKGHGFSYEGSKPGAIVQGLVKMGAMNGMFIMDEVDKAEKFAISTLLEILDPEQNHLFHDKYIQTTVDIDLSNCHFILTANTLETVPPPVINRCEVVFLDRYTVEEKVEIARTYLIERIRRKYRIAEDQVFFDPKQEEDILRHIIKSYTYEAGVRELERVIRTLFLRALRKEVMGNSQAAVLNSDKVAEYLEPARPKRGINEYDGIGEIMGLGVNPELGVGSLIPIQATPVHLGLNGESGRSHFSSVHATGNIQKIMDESRKVAMTAILHCAEYLGIQPGQLEEPIHLHFMGGSTPKDGPSAGGAIALALASVFSGNAIRRDLAMTGEIDTQGRITAIGGVPAKIEAAIDAGCKTIIVPLENLENDEGIEKLSKHLQKKLQVLTYQEWRCNKEPFDHENYVAQIIGVDHILQASDIAFIVAEEVKSLESFRPEYSIGDITAQTGDADRIHVIVPDEISGIESRIFQRAFSSHTRFLISEKQEKLISAHNRSLINDHRLFIVDDELDSRISVLKSLLESHGTISVSVSWNLAQAILNVLEKYVLEKRLRIFVVDRADQSTKSFVKTSVIHNLFDILAKHLCAESPVHPRKVQTR